VLNDGLDWTARLKKEDTCRCLMGYDIVYRYGDVAWYQRFGGP